MATKKETTKKEKKQISNKAKRNWCYVGEWASRVLVPVLPIDTKFHDMATKYDDMVRAETALPATATVTKIVEPETAGSEEKVEESVKEEPENERGKIENTKVETT